MNPHRLSATIDEVESGFFNRWVEVPRIAARCCMCDTAAILAERTRSHVHAPSTLIGSLGRALKTPRRSIFLLPPASFDVQLHIRESMTPFGSMNSGPRLPERTAI